MAQQLKIVSLKCPNCGGVLEISGDMDRFACAYCGSEQIVERRGGTIGLRLVVDAIARVQTGTDKTAAELALVRLDKELAVALECYEEADTQSGLSNPTSNSPTVVLLVVLPIVLLGSLMVFGNAVTSANIGGMLVSMAISIGIFTGFGFALAGYFKAKERHSTERSELLSSHEEEIERLEMQIAKQRRLIHS